MTRFLAANREWLRRLGDAASSGRRSAGLRPEPFGLGLTAAPAIAGALRDPLGLLVMGAIIALTIFAYGAVA